MVYPHKYLIYQNIQANYADVLLFYSIGLIKFNYSKNERHFHLELLFLYESKRLNILEIN